MSDSNCFDYIVKEAFKTSRNFEDHKECDSTSRQSTTHDLKKPSSQIEAGGITLFWLHCLWQSTSWP